MATIIDSITGIKINSAFFNSSPVFELFPPLTTPKKNRITLLYGKNGSGKSSIAQGFREYSDSINPRTVTITPILSDEMAYETSGNGHEKFFIFDEDYIKRSISIKDNGLDAIVLLGDQVGFEAEIVRISQEIKSVKTQQQTQEIECLEFINNANIISPSHWYAKIETTLKMTNGWAEISSRIKGNRRNDSVTIEVVEMIGTLQSTQSQAELNNEFLGQFDLFKKAGDQNEVISRKITPVFLDPNIEIKSGDLLGKTVQRPTLTERENELLQLFGVEGVTNTKAYLADTMNSICKTCFQPIEDEYRKNTILRIESILNRDVEDVKSQLQTLILSMIEGDNFQTYSVLNVQTYNAVMTAISDYNSAVAAHNTLVGKKMDNPFDALVYDSNIKIINVNETLNFAIATLEKEREAYNESITEKVSIQEKLHSLNNAIAHHAIADDFDSYVTQREAKKTADEKLANIKKKISKLEAKKTNLDALRQKIHIAKDEINRSLKYIFFSDKRLELELGSDNVYHLKSNGNPVDPKKVSCGERNALALCYFFTDIARNMDAHSAYSDEAFLIIDDPVSSFDFENKIGISSFLRWKFEQVLDGCATTKILVMSHDISTVFDMKKALDEISSFCEAQGKSAEHRVFELDNLAISDFRYKKRNDYTALLEKTFEYACNRSNESDLMIGNSMRRIMEAFSTFSYKKGIDKVSCDEAILSLIIDEHKREHFKNLMYRLVLNGESHYEDYMRGLQDMNFFGYLSETEKQRTAKEVICFMYLLNKPHVLAHLANITDAEQKINDWCSSIGVS